MCNDPASGHFESTINHTCQTRTVQSRIVIKRKKEEKEKRKKKKRIERIEKRRRRKGREMETTQKINTERTTQNLAAER